MSTPVGITLRDERVGSISFVSPDSRFTAVRTASGFRLQIPIVVTFLPPSVSNLQLVLENLRATFTAVDDSGRPVEIGVARGAAPLLTPSNELPVPLFWDWTLTAMAFYEKLRAGREPRFQLAVTGDVRYILPGESGKEPCSVACAFSEKGEVVYSREVWVRIQQELKLREAILVEIPFPSAPPSGWEEVWQAPRPSDRNSRSKHQRMDNLRWHLLQYAHLAPHTEAGEWSRDDAVLAISTLCSLLAVRDP